jgi:23S rRNA pseudouridine2457 synthase
MNYYAIVYKPFQVLSQFSRVPGKLCLKDVFQVPGDVYPLGRLDYDSEGLLILTNDSDLNQRLLHPRHSHEREYWVQVEGRITDQAQQRLEQGVEITIDGKIHHSRPSKVILLEEESLVPQRDPPIRFRKNIPTSWIRLILTEGKNRQVRKMTAKVGFPTLRLIRYRVSGISLETMKPSDLVEMSKDEIYKKLFSSQPNSPLEG